MNLPLLGAVRVAPLPAGAPPAVLLAADNPDELKPVIDLLNQTRRSLTLRSLFLTGFPHDPEFFAAGLALARQWSRQGLKIAVVDLDFRHPTVARPRHEANEGLVDALEYGCSFQRVAWELVQDALWLVSPGTHPPDETRFREHPDWERVMRIFGGRVDLALYVAPFLDRKGFTGALSKRMDGVILATCVRRASRAALRDAFLELWGSDAPMIGCLGIDAPPVSSQPAAAAVATVPAPEAAPAPAPIVERRKPPGVAFPKTEPAPEAPPQALVARLSDEVRREHVSRSPSSRGRGLILLAVTLAIAGAGAFATYQTLRHGGSRAAPVETLPAGNEPVLPADPGLVGASVPSLGSEETPYRVHVASFETEELGNDLAQRLQAKGLDAWCSKAADQPNWYRVFVGHYATHEEAAREARSLLERGLVEHAIAYPHHAR